MFRSRPQTAAPTSAILAALASALTALPLPAHAEGPTPTASLTWWTAATYTNVLTTSPFNPNNATSALPTFQLQSDLRPDLKLEQQNLKAVVRPRVQYKGKITEQSSTTTQSWNNFALRWSDAFAEYHISDALFVTYGLQNYQWGPAESASPSNPIFHDTIQNRDLLFAVNGRHLLRLNATPTPDLSLVAMFELTENVDGPFVSEQTFLPTFALKGDYSWGGGASQAALIIGGTNERLQLGQTLTLDLTAVTDGLSAYVDASEQLGANVWYPNGITMDKAQLTSSTPTLYAVSGLRYAFESGEDLRAEFVWQGAGYTAAQRATFLAMVQSTNPIVLANLTTSAARAATPGLEFPGQKFVLGSLRVPNFLKKRDWTLYLRYLVSLTDASGSAFATLETPVSDSGALLFSGSATHGPAESELKGTTNGSVVAAYRHVW